MGPWLKLAISTVSGGLAIEQMAGDTRLQCQGLEYLTDWGGGVLVWHWKIVPRLEGPWEEQISESWMHALSPPPLPFFFSLSFFFKLLRASVSWVTAAFINMQNVLQEIVHPLFLDTITLSWSVTGVQQVSSIVKA